MFDVEGQEGMFDGMLIDPTIVINGKDGVDGKDGAPGPEGMPGRDGIDGRDGKDGKDGKDGADGKDGVSCWIEYDKKTNTLYFKNNGNLKNPDPIKLPSAAKGWGFAAGAGRGGGQVQADWNQTNKNDPTFIKNKPAIHNVRFLVVDSLPAVGDSWTIYLIKETTTPGPRGAGSGSDVYSEWVFVYNESEQSYSWEKLGTDVDLSDYEHKTAIEELDATDSITLGDNTVYNGGEQTSLTIALPAASAANFICEIVFTSGSTATTLSYPNTIKWLGDDLTSDVFVPVASKRYTVVIYYDGVEYVGIVKGVV